MRLQQNVRRNTAHRARGSQKPGRSQSLAPVRAKKVKAEPQNQRKQKRGTIYIHAIRPATATSMPTAPLTAFAPAPLVALSEEAVAAGDEAVEAAEVAEEDLAFVLVLVALLEDALEVDETGLAESVAASRLAISP